MIPFFSFFRIHPFQVPLRILKEYKARRGGGGGGLEMRMKLALRKLQQARVDGNFFLWEWECGKSWRTSGSFLEFGFLLLGYGRN
jgi:hypothetical protein